MAAVVGNGRCLANRSQREKVVVPIELHNLAGMLRGAHIDDHLLRSEHVRDEQQEQCQERSKHGHERRRSIGTNAETSALLAYNSRTMVLLIWA